jgi:putative FmdB family regulatory protein
MPIYGFRCPACNMEFEVSRPMKDAGNPVNCPLDGETATRLFTPPR